MNENKNNELLEVTNSKEDVNKGIIGIASAYLSLYVNPYSDLKYIDSYSDLKSTNKVRPKKQYGIRVDVRTEPKIGRNEICPKCDSGLKYKRCCGVSK